MSKLYKKILRPAMFCLDAETAHEVGIKSLQTGLSSRFARRIAAKRFTSEPFEIERFGLKFKNPLGIAAGFDKNGIVVDQLAAMGFGFVEIGTVTHEPQPGNEKPRLFRLPEDNALINRLGFNNDGAVKIAGRLKKIERRCIVGVNIGKNKHVPNEEAVENYLKSFELVHPVADYIAVNISSPNTPNLRELQKADNLEELLGALQEKNRFLSSISPQDSTTQPAETAAATPIQQGSFKKPLLVKIAPDLSAAEIESIVDVCLQFDVAGIIATNTTVRLDNLKTANAESFSKGGLSGRPLFKLSNKVISTIYRYSKGKLPIIGVGGIFTALDAFEKIAAGACLIQAYTGFVYKGPTFARDINRGLRKILDERGFKNVDEAIGSAA